MSIGLIVTLCVVGYIICGLITYFICILTARDELSKKNTESWPVIFAVFWPIIAIGLGGASLFVVLGKAIDTVVLKPIRRLAFKFGEYLDKKKEGKEQ